MISISNYDLFIDKRTSKNGKEYYALYIRFNNDLEELICFINKSTYDKIDSLSK